MADLRFNFSPKSRARYPNKNTILCIR